MWVLNKQTDLHRNANDDLPSICDLDVFSTLTKLTRSLRSPDNQARLNEVIRASRWGAVDICSLADTSHAGGARPLDVPCVGRMWYSLGRVFSCAGTNGALASALCCVYYGVNNRLRSVY
jgi:hypothetical protein